MLNHFKTIAHISLLAVAAVTLAAAAKPKLEKPRILAICTGNSARSQITAGFLRSFDPRLDVYSAGTAPPPKSFNVTPALHSRLDHVLVIIDFRRFEYTDRGLD